MPLIDSASKKARQENIRREIDSGAPIKQAVAIGYSKQRQAAGKKGHRSTLDHAKVSKWTRGERRDYR
jgi:hypothetical protein